MKADRNTAGTLELLTIVSGFMAGKSRSNLELGHVIYEFSSFT